MDIWKKNCRSSDTDSDTVSNIEQEIALLIKVKNQNQLDIKHHLELAM